MLTLLWDITSKCNLKCLHCYNASKYFFSNKKHELIFNYDIEKIIQKISYLSINHLHLLGGEPLLSKKIFDILKLSSKYKIVVSINTNGTLLNSDTISKLLKFSNLSQIIVSLDGPNEKANDEIRGKNTFGRVIKNIRNLVLAAKNYKPDLIIAINTVVSKHSAIYLKEFPEIMKEMGVKYLFISTLYDCGSARQNKMMDNKYFYNFIPNLVELLKSIKNEKNISIQLDVKPKLATYINRLLGSKFIKIDSFNCNAGESLLFMDSNGFIYPCASTTQPIHKYKMDFDLNIKNLKTCKEFSPNKIFKNFLKIKESMHTTYCKKCEFIEICSGICPLYKPKSKFIPLECKTVDFFQNKLFYSILTKKYRIVNKEKCRINNHTEKVIVDMIGKNCKVKEIIDILSYDYKIEEDVLIKDICGYILDLVVEGIIIEKKEVINNEIY